MPETLITEEEKHYLKQYITLFNKTEQTTIDFIKHISTIVVTATALMVALHTPTTCNKYLVIIYLVMLSSSGLCILLTPILLFLSLKILNDSLEALRLDINKSLSEERDSTSETALSVPIPSYFGFLKNLFFISSFIFFILLVIYGVWVNI